jgi:hypothetical protein
VIRFAVPGVLTAADLQATVDSIAALQLPSGIIPWFPGGHTDPWNHVECAMALTLGGRTAEAELAYEWLLNTQRGDGSWHNYYLAHADGRLEVEDAKLDTNVCAYIATGVWHHYVHTGDEAFAARLWPCVERAIDWVLTLQTPRGDVIWARHADGRPWTYSLLTGCSSIALSIRCALALADVVDEERLDWELAVSQLEPVIRDHPDAFEPKRRWAMDWYYPVLAGVLRPEQGLELLRSRQEEFIMPGKGIRCVRDAEWVTASETSEAVMAYLAAGDRETALDLFSWSQALRDADGAYFTGLAYPEMVHFPADERSAYTAAAVVLAAHALATKPFHELITK